MYEVIIDKIPSCTCPDAGKGNHCKHIVRWGVLLPKLLVHCSIHVSSSSSSKVNRVASIIITGVTSVFSVECAYRLAQLLPEVSVSSRLAVNLSLTMPMCFRALITDELKDIFAAAPVNPTVVASRKVREAYAAATGSSVKDSSPKDAESSVMRKDPNGEDCAICYEAFRGSMAELERFLVWCDTCQNAVHKECFNQCAS